MDGGYTKSDMDTVLLATCVAALVTPLMSTMMNLALLSIGEEFGVGSHDQAYVNTLFLLGSVFGMVPAAKYSSIYGMKKMFVWGHLILLAGCVLAISSPNFWFLVSMRFVIGFGASMIAVTAMSMLTFVFPIEHRGKMLGINTTFVYIGLSLGPTIGGVLTDFLGWRAIFASIVLLSILPIAAILKFRSEIIPTPDKHMDWVGSVMWGATVLVLMFGVVNVTESWAKIMIVLGLVMLAGTWMHFRRTPEPVLSVSMFRNRVFTRASIAAFMNYGASYCITFFLALCTMLAINVFANKEYWKEIFWPEVPLFLKAYPAPIMPVIELFGVFTKPFALMIRLFANMMAGHAVILSFTCVIFLGWSMGVGYGLGLNFFSIIMLLFMNLLEVLVAFVQAYVFTMLSAVFIGLAHKEHGEE